MAYLQSFQNEGLSTIKPPFFNGIDFNYWKSRMECFLKSIDYDLWYIVIYGDIIPRTKVGDTYVDKVHVDLDDN